MNLQRDKNSNLVWLFGWAVAAIILVAGAGMAAINHDFAEPDNAMRLVRGRDMLAGQGWFDNIRHRLNPPVGRPMHWAQWIDAMFAAPIALLALIVGQVNAETALAFAWPLGLLGGFMFLAVRIGGELGPADGLKREAQWAAAIVAALAFPTTEKFAPGSFDHHNIVLVLILASV
jgi:asparagine N-glycosylation enzyme membrane subunit Stt3